MRAVLRLLLQMLAKVFPSLPLKVEALKYRVGQLRKTGLHLTDARRNAKFMDWRARRDLTVIESELIFQFHKIEKGLCMPPPKRFFGADAARKTISLIHEWRDKNGDLAAPCHLGAIEALRSYATMMTNTPPPPSVQAWLKPMIDSILTPSIAVEEAYKTPLPLISLDDSAAECFAHLMLARRSVRNFSPVKIPNHLLEAAIKVAQLSPSACNRQPWQVHVYDDPNQIKAMLKLQNGNTGFGHLVQTLLVLTSVRTCFFDATERNQPYIDGGLFSMSLILALQSMGVASCCLNWCVERDRDEQAHATGNIPDDEAILMYLAVGFADPDALTPKSARKNTQAIMHWH